MRFLRAAAALSILMGLAGCRGQQAFTARNCVLVTLHSFGADQAGCYGNAQARTPGLDRLARQGAAFRDAITPTVESGPALACLLSGAQPWESATSAGEDAPTRNSMLAEACRGAAWRTAAFVTLAEPAQNEELRRGFETFESTPAAGAAVDRSLEWISELGPDASFLLVVQSGSESEDDRSPAMRAARADRELLRLTRGLEVNAHLHRTMLLVTADHAGLRHRVDDSALRVPLIGWGPFPFRGGAPRVDLARTVDVTPTVLDALRVGTRADRPGRPLQKRLKPFREAALRAFADVRTGSGPQDRLRTVRLGFWKLVRGEGEQLFDLATDPGERHNVREANPEPARALREALRKEFGQD